MGKAWYVLHIYSGYEKKVEESIHALIKDAQMKESKIADILFQIKVPLREVSEVKNCVNLLTTLQSHCMVMRAKTH